MFKYLEIIDKKSKLGHFLRFPLKLLPSDTVVPVLWGKLYGSKWIIGSLLPSCWLGSYEYLKQRIFCKLVTKNSIVYDVGAHVGFYTLLASRIVYPKGKVYAFEPVAANVKYLEKHVCLNGCTNVRIFEVAVSNKNGKAMFQTALSHPYTIGRLSTNGNLKVNTVRLDDFIIENNLDYPDFIKMDIEGGELKALKGAAAVISKKKPAFFLGTHGKNVHIECCNFLLSLGYTLHPIKGKSVWATDEILATARTYHHVSI